MKKILSIYLNNIIGKKDNLSPIELACFPVEFSSRKSKTALENSNFNKQKKLSINT